MQTEELRKTVERGRKVLRGSHILLAMVSAVAILSVCLERYLIAAFMLGLFYFLASLTVACKAVLETEEKMLTELGNND